MAVLWLLCTESLNDAQATFIFDHVELLFQCRGVLLILIIVGQDPTVLTVGAAGGCLDIFSLVYYFSILSLGDGPIYTEILSQRAVKPKNNQKKNEVSVWSQALDGNFVKKSVYYQMSICFIPLSKISSR